MKNRLRALNIQISTSGEVPDWVELIPAGQTIKGRDGREFVNDNPQGIVDVFAANGAPLPLDLEHATELKAPNGDAAPAVGWIEELQIREGGAIWGRIDWTDQGRQLVSSRAYRYLSPVLLLPKGKNTIVGIDSAGLTNKHNLHLSALNQQQKEIPMKNLLKKLGLPEDASEEQALNALATLQGDLETARNRQAMPDLGKFVPRADYDQALDRATNAEQKLTQKQEQELETAVNSEIDAALKAGKIAPASKDFYTSMCRSEDGLAQFKKFVETAPVIAAPSGLDDKEAPAGKKSLNAEEKKIAALFGNSEEDLQKYA